MRHLQTQRSKKKEKTKNNYALQKKNETIGKGNHLREAVINSSVH